GLEDVLSWLLVDGKHDSTIVDINAIALLRQAIGSSPGKNTGIVSPGSIWGKSSIDCGSIVDDEVLHKLVSMVEKNELVKELMIDVMDTEQNLTEFDS
ncbi:hypothetical protein Tco_0208487, partial [Tanacetum coccineum]